MRFSTLLRVAHCAVAAALGLGFAAGTPLASAQTPLNPNPTTVERTYEPKGKVPLPLLKGDPKRVVRANEIRRDDFDVSPLAQPNPVSLAFAQDEGLPTVKIGLMVHNKSRFPKTLNFPNTKRVDVVVRNASGQPVYTWSANKEFMDVFGTSLVMPDEKLRFTVDVPLQWWDPHVTEGLYRFTAELANYPEFTAEGTLDVTSRPVRAATELDTSEQRFDRPTSSDKMAAKRKKSDAQTASAQESLGNWDTLDEGPQKPKKAKDKKKKPQDKQKAQQKKAVIAPDPEPVAPAPALPEPDTALVGPPLPE